MQLVVTARVNGHPAFTHALLHLLPLGEVVVLQEGAEERPAGACRVGGGGSKRREHGVQDARGGVDLVDGGLEVVPRSRAGRNLQRVLVVDCTGSWRGRQA